MWKIYDYRFEVERNINNNEKVIKCDSLNSALAIISFDDWLLMKYELQIEDRITTEFKEDLQYKDIAHLNEQKILDMFIQVIKIKHNQNKNKEEK